VHLQRDGVVGERVLGLPHLLNVAARPMHVLVASAAH
jgi:hypothetical protein